MCIDSIKVQMNLVLSFVCFLLRLLCVCATTSISSLQWTSGGMRVDIATDYAAFPASKSLLVIGLGNCAVQMKDSWQRHFALGDPAPTGTCDTWPSDATANSSGVPLYFGSESLQASYIDYPSLTQTNQLYGFNQLPGRTGQVNRLYRTPQQSNHVNWFFSGDNGIAQPTTTTPLPLYIQLESSYAQLANCDRYGGNSALTVTSSGGRTSYTFGVYVLHVKQGNRNQLVTDCEQRQYTHSVGSSVSATWGGFTTSESNATIGATPLGVRAEYALVLQLDPSEASTAFQDESVYTALEEQLMSILMALASESWTIDVEIGTISSSIRRASSFQVSFTVTFGMAASSTATSDVATMGAVLRQVVGTAISSTPNFASTFVNLWRERYINATGKAWPLPSVQIANPPFLMTSPPTTLTAPPTPAPGQQTPTTAPTLGDDSKEGLATWVIAIIVVGVCIAVAAVAFGLWYYRTHTTRQPNGSSASIALRYIQLHQNKELY